MNRKEVLDWLYRIKSKLTMYFPVKWVSECEQAVDYAIKALENQKTGHWIEKEDYNGDTYYDCSECGESFCLIEGTPIDNLYNYCPNCGAKMEENKE